MKTVSVMHSFLMGKTVKTFFNGRTIEGRIVDTTESKESGSVWVAINPFCAQDNDINGKWISMESVTL